MVFNQVLKACSPEVVNVADVDKGDLLVHDAHKDDPTHAFMLSRLETKGHLRRKQRAARARAAAEEVADDIADEPVF